jgi:hypothetical protein
MPWEYMTVECATGNVDELGLQLTALGSVGWEAIAYTGVEALGPNFVSVILKRQTVGYPPPTETAPGWRPDPTGRHQLRHWDGLRWTQHVSDNGTADTDWPNVRR